MPGTDNTTWRAEADAPTGVWLVTRREGEMGINYCHLRITDGTREWIDQHGRTTVTHGSFAPPTQWRYVNEVIDDVNI